MELTRLQVFMLKATGRYISAISTRGAFGSNDNTLIFNLTNGERSI